VNVPANTPLQTVNHAADDLLVYACGHPPDEGAEMLDSAI
jgi:hypothetical protein